MRPERDVVSQRVDDEVVLVHLQTNRIYSLNPTSARFWELLTAGHDRARIEREMSKEFAVDPVRLSSEIDGLVASLASAGLVTVGESS